VGGVSNRTRGGGEKGNRQKGEVWGGVLAAMGQTPHIVLKKKDMGKSPGKGKNRLGDWGDPEGNETAFSHPGKR